MEPPFMSDMVIDLSKEPAGTLVRTACGLLGLLDVIGDTYAAGRITSTWEAVHVWNLTGTYNGTASSTKADAYKIVEIVGRPSRRSTDPFARMPGLPSSPYRVPGSSDEYLASMCIDIKKERQLLGEELAKDKPAKPAIPEPPESREDKLRLIQETFREWVRQHGTECVWSPRQVYEATGIPEAELYEHDNFTGLLMDLANRGVLVRETCTGGAHFAMDYGLLELLVTSLPGTPDGRA
jgi:hypothetical protein